MKLIRIALLSVIVFVSNTIFASAQNLHLIAEGTNNTETLVIDSIGYKNLFKNYNALEKEIYGLQTKLIKSGFIESALSLTRKIDDTTYHAKFSLKKKFYTIYIYYNKNEVPKQVLETVSDAVTPEYFITTIQESERVLNLINAKVSENGQPFTSLKLVNLKKKNDNHLQANLVISNTKKRTVDKIIIKGYEKFPKPYLRHFLKIKQGDDFDLNSIKEKAEALNALSFSNQIKPPEVLFTQDSTNLYLYLEKTKANNFDGFLGFGTNETTNKIEFDGYLNLTLINNLNYGESFNLIYKSDENEQKTFNVNLNLPYLFGSAVGSELSLNIIKRDSTYTIIDQTANLFYQINGKQKVYAGITTIQSNDLLNENQSLLIQDYNAFYFNFKYQFVKYQFNNLLFPINFIFDAKTGLGTREFGNSKERQTILSVITHKIINLNKKNSVFLRVQSQGIISNTYLTNELFRFGGINSIRGFEENSLLASFYAVLNTEYRYNLSQSIYLHSIIDGAYFENKLTNQKEKLFGFGFGFGLITKAGLLKFNYANGKSENQRFKLSDSKIHISLNAKF